MSLNSSTDSTTTRTCHAAGSGPSSLLGWLPRPKGASTLVHGGHPQTKRPPTLAHGGSLCRAELQSGAAAAFGPPVPAQCRHDVSPWCARSAVVFIALAVLQPPRLLGGLVTNESLYLRLAA